MDESKLSEVSMSGEIGELAKALALAQSEMRGAVADSENPFFKSSYADLASVWDACRAPLTKNGLSVIQVPTNDNGRVVLLSILAHASGQWISGKLSVKPKADDPQGIGSAITYARRYALAALVGVATIDDDGEEAQGRKGGGPSPAALAAQKKADAQVKAKKDAPPASEPFTPNSISQIRARSIGMGQTTEAELCRWIGQAFDIGVTSAAELTPEQAEKVLTGMKADMFLTTMEIHNARAADLDPAQTSRLPAIYAKADQAKMPVAEWKGLTALVGVTKGCRDPQKIDALEKEVDAWILLYGKKE